IQWRARIRKSRLVSLVRRHQSKTRDKLAQFLTRRTALLFRPARGGWPQAIAARVRCDALSPPDRRYRAGIRRFRLSNAIAANHERQLEDRLPWLRRRRCRTILPWKDAGRRLRIGKV